jgi:hypothetical protein
MTYSGIPIHFRKLRKVDWKNVEEEVEQLERETSVNRGRLTLINSVLSNLLLYMMSFFFNSNKVLKKLDYFCSRFFLAKR